MAINRQEDIKLLPCFEYLTTEIHNFCNLPFTQGGRLVTYNSSDASELNPRYAHWIAL